MCRVLGKGVRGGGLDDAAAVWACLCVPRVLCWDHWVSHVSVGSLRVSACLPLMTLRGYFSRTRLKCSFTVVKTPLHCTRKWSCNLSCTSAELQLPCKGSTGQVPLPEHEISQGTPRTCTRCSSRNFHVPAWGPDQLNRCKEAATGSMLTCSSNCSYISWYNTMGFLPTWSCTWVAFWKNSHLPVFLWRPCQ